MGASAGKVSERAARAIQKMAAAMHDTNSRLDDADVEALWKRYDHNRTGYLELEDLKALLRDLQDAIFSRPDIPPTERERALREFDADSASVLAEFERFDTDHDGKIQKEDFFAGIHTLYGM
eukprot:EC792769.1.p2 GENE.EC792769.1~~EC792769.1.p2  ORF type:complete len:122 (+),score=20.42 EC792769.1:72-437(+)